MRKAILAAVFALGATIAQAQVVSPLGGSTSNPQSPPPATRTPRTAAPMTAPAAAPAAPAPSATTAAPSSDASSSPRRSRRSLAERFAAANATHDGKLTLDQARTGRLRAVVRDWDQIDTGKRGYVTLDEIKAHQTSQREARRAARAQKPTAQ